MSVRGLQRKLREMSGELDGGEPYTAETLSTNLASLARRVPVPMEDIETESSAAESDSGMFY